MSKIIIKYPNQIGTSEGGSFMLKFDWNKSMGAYEYKDPNSGPWLIKTPPLHKKENHILDHLSKYDNLLIPVKYHSEFNTICQVFILDVREIERHLKLQELDI